MPGPAPRYVWPSSALTVEDMALLHAARESSETRATISGLVAAAVRAAYGRHREGARPAATPPATQPRKDKENTP